MDIIALIDDGWKVVPFQLDGNENSIEYTSTRYSEHSIDILPLTKKYPQNVFLLIYVHCDDPVTYGYYAYRDGVILAEKSSIDATNSISLWEAKELLFTRPE